MNCVSSKTKNTVSKHVLSPKSSILLEIFYRKSCLISNCDLKVSLSVKMKPVFVLLILALGGLFKQLGGIAWQVFGGVFLLTRYEKSE